MIWHPNVLVIGSPGSGKSEAAARDAVEFPGAIFVADPHKDSLAQRVLENAEGNILYDRLSNLKETLSYDLLKPSKFSDPVERSAENHRRAQLFVEIMMRRRGTEVTSAPLMEEWIMALLLLFLFQTSPKPLRMLPFGFMPGTDEFRALVKDCPLPEIREKFRQLESLRPRALRAEVGSATRLVNAIFRSPAFLARCEGGFDLGAFLQKRGKLILEKGDDVDEDAVATIIGAINLLIIDHAKNRPSPNPPIRIYLDEATNAKTAGRIEEKAAGETRKYSLSWYVMCQHPNFPGGPEGYFQNFIRKEIYRTADYTLARKLATIIASEHPGSEESRAAHIARLTSDIMNLKPGFRFVTGPGGSRKPKYVPMLEGWPDWPGLREAKLEEKKCQIYSRPEYQTQDRPKPGKKKIERFSSSSESSPPPAPTSPPSSAAKQKKSARNKPTDGS